MWCFLSYCICNQSCCTICLNINSASQVQQCELQVCKCHHLSVTHIFVANRNFTQFGRNGASLKSIVTIWTMKSQSPEQCKVEVQIVRICGSNLEPWDFSAKIVAMKCSDFTLHSGSVRFQYTSVTFSNLILAPTGAQEVLCLCVSLSVHVLHICEFFTQSPCCLLGVS